MIPPLIPSIAIVKATEGGWRYPDRIISRNEVALDPGFWRGLSRNYGWKSNWRDWKDIAVEFMQIIVTDYREVPTFWSKILGKDYEEMELVFTNRSNLDNYLLPSDNPTHHEPERI